jgi:drug/metabolite transporter (DMT)-like permease
VRLPGDPLASTAFQMLAGGAVMVIAGTLTGEAGQINLAHVSTRSALAFAYLVGFGSLAAFTAYSWLLQHVPISRVSTYAYVNPVIAVGLGWSVLGERIATTTAVGAAVIVAAVAFIVRSTRLAAADGAGGAAVASAGRRV